MSDARPNGPIPGPLGRLLAKLYGRVMARKNRRFDTKRGVVTLDRPVISIGNLSVGGTGKTPLVMTVTRWLKEHGRAPCIAMRGYGSTKEHGSDEAMLYTQRLPGMCVVAKPNRTDGLIRLFGTPEGERVDCIVLDDGFQHRQLARALDIVVIDATRSPWEDALLPAGWLREPVQSLRRAHAVVITHAQSATERTLDALRARIQAVHPSAQIALTTHGWEHLTVYAATGGHVEPEGWLLGKRVLAVSAIGNPRAFLEAVTQAAKPADAPASVESISLRDHDPFRARTVKRIFDEAKAHRAEAIVVTEKDWMKLRSTPPISWPCPIVVPSLELRFISGEQALRNAVLHAAHPPDDEGEGTFPPDDELEGAVGGDKDDAAQFLDSSNE